MGEEEMSGERNVRLSLYRRHLKECPHRGKGGTEKTKCSCPVWCDGEIDGKRYRRSLETCDWQRAIRKLAALEDPRAPRVKPVSDAITAFENHILSLEHSTQRKYKNVLRHFGEYCARAGLHDIMQVTVESVDGFRATRKLSPTTSTKELQTLRQFFGFCFERRWTEENPAKKIKLPRNIKPEEVVPYKQSEVAKIIGACEAVGRGPYERLRARAMVLLLRYTGLRISDVATLARDRVQGGQVLLHTQKTGGTVFLPVPEELQKALDSLPLPRGAGETPRYFFWNGKTSKRAVVGIAERTMAAVFARSGVADAHAHRFRHTLATEILASGKGGEQDVADILAISPAVVRKHYAKWSQTRQQRVSRVFEAVYPGTYLVHDKKSSVIN
jgi:site-specific recombinase XerD